MTQTKSSTSEVRTIRGRSFADMFVWDAERLGRARLRLIWAEAVSQLRTRLRPMLIGGIAAWALGWCGNVLGLVL